jgi:hypothetical protein
MPEPVSASVVVVWVAKTSVDVLVIASTLCLAVASTSVAQHNFRPSIAAPPLNYSAAHSFSVFNKQGPTTQPNVSHATDIVLYKDMKPHNLSGLSSTHEDVIRNLQLSVQKLRNTNDLQAQKIETQAQEIKTQADVIKHLTLNTTSQQSVIQKQTILTMRLKRKIFQQKGFIKKQTRQQRVKMWLIQKIQKQKQTMRNLTNTITSQKLNSCTMCGMKTGTLLYRGAFEIWLAASAVGGLIFGGIYAACLAAVEVQKRNPGQYWLMLTVFATTLSKPVIAQLWCMFRFCGQFDQNTIVVGYSQGILTVGWLTVGFMIFAFLWWAICWLCSYRRNRMMRIRMQALDIWSTLIDSTQRQEHYDSVKLALEWKKRIRQTSYNVQIMDMFISRWKTVDNWTD